MYVPAVGADTERLFKGSVAPSLPSQVGSLTCSSHGQIQNILIGIGSAM